MEMDIVSIIILGMVGLSAATIIYDFVKIDEYIHLPAATNTKRKQTNTNKNTNKKTTTTKRKTRKPKVKSQTTSYNRNNYTYSYLYYIEGCKNKIEEIRNIIKDFDYSNRNTYEKSCSEYEKSLSEIENGLPNFINFIDKQTVDRVNNLIDEINRTYKNAYNKKNNESPLAYIMETEEDIDLIKKININDFK